ncbi:CDP-diacylglycerol--serine O-phosphatidyltransferase [Clostridium putrefaciens]|uniref:CDP-diacylglycerol--serine O-phosphatidyltransferase n=1 Tax=Clostridium putrefaciens TaxID=99675 RepID=A0A381J7Q6_9CLOT|nr:CDP-diacylglycerol--serine O-phosphatidyltransferase [Clostridium putrefaciens]SUY46728.1 CDP-diacylglycerol--serine O-phosphatidyltransferase [Clostridium putrefaciens]
MYKIKNAIPNVLTLSNLGCGVMSLLMTLDGNYILASLFIILAGLADRYDGIVARALNVSSEIGKELDSLSDLISFGVAPALLIFNLYSFKSIGFLGYMVLLAFPIAGAYRLARYNISDFDGVFKGIPITFAGILIALFVLVTKARFMNPSIIVILAAILSYLMVSNIRFQKR